MSEGAISPGLLVVAFAGFVAWAVWVSMIAPTRQGYVPGKPPTRRRPDHHFGSNAARFRGGIRSGWFNASWPLAQMRLDDTWIHIRSAFANLWIARDEVTEVQRIQLPTLGRLGHGIRFATTTGAFDGVIFWTFRQDEVCSALHDLGWRVTN